MVHTKPLCLTGPAFSFRCSWYKPTEAASFSDRPLFVVFRAPSSRRRRRRRRGRRDTSVALRRVPNARYWPPPTTTTRFGEVRFRICVRRASSLSALDAPRAPRRSVELRAFVSDPPNAIRSILPFPVPSLPRETGKCVSARKLRSFPRSAWLLVPFRFPARNRQMCFRAEIIRFRFSQSPGGTPCALWSSVVNCNFFYSRGLLEKAIV